MKKIAVLTNVLIVALVAGLACSINNESGLEPNTVDNEPKTLTVADFDYAGQLHNDGLTYIEKNLDRLPENPTTKELMDFIHHQTSDFVSTQTILGNPFPQEVTEETYLYSNGNYLVQKTFVQPKAKNASEVSDVYKLLESLRPSMSDQGYDFYVRIFKILEDNYTRKISLKTTLAEFENLNTLYEKTQFSRDSKDGKNIGIVLSVAKYSFQWWEDYFISRDHDWPDMLEYPDYPWLERDVLAIAIATLENWEEQGVPEWQIHASGIRKAIQASAAVIDDDVTKPDEWEWSGPIDFDGSGG